MTHREPSLEHETRAELADLLAAGRLRVVEARVDPRAFENALVTLAGGGLLVRFATDRGDLYAELARVPSRSLAWTRSHGTGSWTPRRSPTTRDPT